MPGRPLRLADIDYDLPEQAIAQEPVERRDAARLLVDRGPGRPVEHRTVADLPELVGPGDLLVVNETRVLPARLGLVKPTGGAVEVLLLEPDPDEVARGPSLSGWASWIALVRPGRRVPPGTPLSPVPGQPPVVVVGEVLGDGRRRVRFSDDPAGVLATHGTVPLPPYVHRPLDDPERYQTVYARAPGSVAAPTAGLHLTTEVLAACVEAGAALARVDLAVGLDTFRPVEVEDPTRHPIHEERYRVPVATLDACAAAQRVVAVGTTVVRALESAARAPRPPAGVDAVAGRTDLFIHGDFEFLVVDALLTNFHLPRSTLLLLIDAFVGPRWRTLYEEALRAGYRFLSFGDAMLLERPPGPPASPATPREARP